MTFKALVSTIEEPTISHWFKHNLENPNGERLGQAFINDFIRVSWPELYYCEDVEKSYSMILQWLHDHHYNTHMPKRLREVK